MGEKTCPEVLHHLKQLPDGSSAVGQVWELTQEDQDLVQLNAILSLVWCLSLVALPGQPCDVLEASAPCLLAFF